ncbi:MAG: nickel pincer cofactor biosynthesis protein LarC [Solirubrobacteraceae bacterium]
MQLRRRSRGRQHRRRPRRRHDRRADRSLGGSAGLSRLLYLDCVGGIAGDMLLAALLDVGADPDAVRAGLAGLGIDGLELAVDRAHRHDIAASTAVVRAPAGQPHRRWGTIRAQLDGARLPERARARAQDAFLRLANAEGAVHGVDPDEVEFHEVGATDALGEVCGVALALEELDVDRVTCSPLPVPRGLVDAHHGRLPLPAPATLELLEGAPLYGVEVDAELVTPTGAALVAALAEGYGALPPMTLEAVGYGAGARDLAPLPNVVRVIMGEGGSAEAAGAAEGRPAEAVVAPVSLIEANLDDLVPELVPDAAGACFAAGAVDVWTTPAQMKHGRPGFVLSALARPGEEAAVAQAVLRETSTLGVRIAHLRRWELEREWRTVDVDGEPVRVKVSRLDGRVVNLAPEHADCEQAARRAGATVKTVWARALAAAHHEHEPQ